MCAVNCLNAYPPVLLSTGSQPLYINCIGETNQVRVRVN